MSPSGHTGRAGGSANIATWINVNLLNAAQLATAVQVYDWVGTTRMGQGIDEANEDAEIWYNANGGLFYYHNNTIFSKTTGYQYDDCNSTESLYAHYTDCEPSCGPSDRIYNEESGVYYLMDVMTGAGDWDDMKLSWTAQLNSYYDGITWDDGGGVLGANYVWPSRPYGYTDEAYWAAKSATHNYMAANAASGKKTLFNGYRYWYENHDFGNGADGGKIESCIQSTVTSPVHGPTDHAWIEADVNAIFETATHGKILVCHPKEATDDLFTTDERMVAFAGFLLAQNPTYHYYFVMTKMVFQARWYPEYLINIGSPVGSFTEMAELENEDGLFIRNYTNGIVVLNDTEGAINYTMPTCMFSFAITGGGAIGTDGSLPGSLTTTIECGTVSIASGTAKIYKYKPGQVAASGTVNLTSGGTITLK